MKMSEAAKHMMLEKVCTGEELKRDNNNHNNWVEMEDGEDVISSESSSMESSENSIESSLSSSSSDLVEEEDDASSSSTMSSSSTVNGPLHELSELMTQLPIKRGLSMFYKGKSQSYTSLARVKSIEDLAKKENSYSKLRMKSCKSYARDLDAQNKLYSPRAIISKKVSRGSSVLSSLSKRSASIGGLQAQRTSPHVL